MRCWLYSHDSVGLGSLRRQLAIAAAVEELAASAKVLLTTCLNAAWHFSVPSNCEILNLPGLPEIPARAIRLLEIARTFRPDVMLVDKHPFGIGGELSAPIKAVKKAGGRVFFGLRDILDDRESVRKKWLPSDIQKRIALCYDQILIYGSASIFDVVEEYQFSSPLRERTRYCGYVVNPIPPEPEPSASARSAQSAPLVIACAGGGADGMGLLQAFIQAAQGASWRGSVVTGPLLDEQGYLTVLRMASSHGVSCCRFNPNLASLFPKAGVVVCMGGYNTLMEALSSHVPVICVPRTLPRSEQFLRASLFERLGLLRMITQDKLSSGGLAAAINVIFGESRKSVSANGNALLSFDGAKQAARLILDIERPGF